MRCVTSHALSSPSVSGSSRREIIILLLASSKSIINEIIREATDQHNVHVTATYTYTSLRSNEHGADTWECTLHWLMNIHEDRQRLSYQREIKDAFRFAGAAAC